ncbi:MAG: toxin-antitoxin system, antitoxin component [bacterium]|nr:toxin-antitoxin system, antitoxin component [bacterium]
MAQISIQLDASTLKALEMTATRNQISISKWIKDRIRLGLKQEWPENYFAIFGSLDEDDLVEPPEIPIEHESHCRYNSFS